MYIVSLCMLLNSRVQYYQYQGVGSMGAKYSLSTRLHTRAVHGMCTVQQARDSEETAVTRGN